MSPQVWLVTGSTSGIGAALIDHIASRGDRVIASGRDVVAKLGNRRSENFEVLELELNSDFSNISVAIQKAWEIYGHIDVLVNNAGMTGFKGLENASEEQLKTIFQVNYTSAMYLTKAILPLFRSQGHGVIGFTSSSTAWSSLPFMTHYGASKAALGMFAETIHKETSAVGIKSVAFDCGGFPTMLGQPRDSNSSAFGSEPPAGEAYKEVYEGLLEYFSKNDVKSLTPGDVGKAAQVMVDIMKGEGLAAGRPWPTRVALGSDAYELAKTRCEEQLILLERWKDVSHSTDRADYTPLQGMSKFNSIL